MVRIMDPPLIRYATTADGVSIAYWAHGHGPTLIQLPSLPHSHIQMEWDTAEWRRGFELMATERTVVRYDGRGTGLSQRNVSDFSLEAMLADLDAVMRDLGTETVALYGIVNSCPIAISYACRHPERVSSLILWCPVIDGSVHRGNPTLRAARQVMETNWEMFSETVAHSLVGWSEPGAARRFATLIREGIDQETALALVPALHDLNATDDLPRVRCRTLVMHRPGLPLLPAGSAEQVAAAIPGAQLALFEGSSSAPYIGDWRSIYRTISVFLGLSRGAPQAGSSRRALRLLSMRDESLTPREREIVSLVVDGRTNRQIADALFLAEKTVENHIGRILLKLDLRSRTQLAAYALKHGLTGRTA
jgi:DNA-binding CsgD family transcriptional regulator/pimeloyl-ACP methyl ester carboxylesterase